MDALAADELSVDLLLDEDVLSEDCIVLLDAADAGAFDAGIGAFDSANFAPVINARKRAMRITKKRISVVTVVFFPFILLLLSFINDTSVIF
ncbi:hypothetical protein [Enterococcus gilvus]|uniref:hypothetical protein n=1 Tax=Enterococcus gilvus TaxID=160453 RepID=UPI00345E820C